MLIGVPLETLPGEKRVATVPEVVEKLIKLGFQVAVQSGAGNAANFADDTYRAAGASVVPTAADIWAKSDIVFKARVPTPDEVAMLRQGGTLIGFVWPAQNPELMQQLAAKMATVLAIDCLPRQLSRAQKMDALTSMAGISGYRAVIEAANAFGRFFNGQITAAGKIPPAKVFIAGAGRQNLRPRRYAPSSRSATGSPSWSDASRGHVRRPGSWSNWARLSRWRPPQCPV